MLRGSAISIVVLSLGQLALAAPAPGQGTHRIALLIGNNRGLSSEDPLRFAEQEAGELAAVLEQVGGFQPEWTYLLLGRDAAAVRSTFAEVDERIEEIGPAGRILLLVYYSGHADGTAMHLNGSALPIEELRRFVTGSKAQIVIGVMDACHSGTLARSKGLSRREGFEIRALAPDKASNMKGHVIITSSGPEELSQEADSVRGSFFSHYMLSGLRGSADSNQDGQVTLGELYQYAYARTLERTARSSIGPQHATSEVDLYGTGEVTLTHLDQGNASILFPEGLEGTFYILKKRGRRLVAEVNLAGEAVRIALAADSYLVQRRAEGKLWVAQMNLSWGGEHRFDAAAMKAFELETSSARGSRRLDLSPHRFTLAFEMRNGSVEGEGQVPGVQIAYGYRAADFALGLRGFWAGKTFKTRDTYVHAQEIDASLSGGMAFERGDLDLLVGLGAGLRYVYQDVHRARNHGAFGGQFEAIGQCEYLMLDPLFLIAELGVGMTLFRTDAQETSVRPLIRGSLGFGAMF